jgi:hypothetical protein
MNEYWLVSLGLTLMMYDWSLETHVQTQVRNYDYFYKVPTDLRASLTPENWQNRILEIAQSIYYDHRLRLQQAEPNDPNYIAIVNLQYRQLNPQEITDQIWLSAQPPVWENSHCINVSADGYGKANPTDF